MRKAGRKLKRISGIFAENVYAHPLTKSVVQNN